ncbi:glutamine synthetase [Haloferax mediterranei ATCC 33500]|uniref:Glutamate--ammonia ligase n=2 Tax=Haloferax mediterranei TaxID=2252 RepID=I3R582_HALMT|nr:gamma-glutamylputrescine synthetase [Haloferax mediterranei]AFK19392.1 glutamate--ammonia ligase [Haloferax mediterranei ATCC 33500]AHZ21258.1 glutamine synthetase [Haloferax mediterranei ATCC 33500]EMA04419.1 glutamine synthetase [Haloferax mediterranei ATCC 33500]MDX5989495.1 glutamine synthetase family protein [Haloferax mediterranei ATCC 33500]QCQ75855.1 glutamine synthetase [Haloferax mediterranei ATCC 33500]
MEPQSILAQCEDAGVELVRLLYVGNDGHTHGHSVKRAHLEDALESGIQLPKLIQSFNALGMRVKDADFDAVGEVRLVPDRSTFRVLDHEDSVAAVCCSLYEIDDQTPWAADPRSALSGFISTLADDDVVPSTALESEFHFYTSEDGDDEPHGTRGLYATASMREFNDIVLETIDALEAQQINVKKHCPEYAAGQHELVTKHREGLTPVDDYVFLRETVAAIAESHGFETTFLPFPFETATNGCHINLSLWNDTNLFAPTDSDRALSSTGRHFVGGVLAHLPALLALTSPTVNSYARLQPQSGAAAFGCWGIGNREAAIRVPEVPTNKRETATRIEFRPADNTANPYLSLLGLLAAGWDGVQNEIDPGRPLDEDPGNCSDELLDERGIERLPQTLGEALDALEKNEVLREALGEQLFDSYLTVKRHEWDVFTASAATWQQDIYREAF